MAASVSESLRSVLNDFSRGVGKEEYIITHLEDDSDREYGDTDREYGDIPADQIYKETMPSCLNFLNNGKVKSVGKTAPLQNKQNNVSLLTREAIRRHRSKYDFLHVGLVQARVVPEHSNLDDIRILVCLRDSKFPDFKESVLAAFETGFHDGGIKFNWFPNFSSSLSDLANSNGLVMTIEPQDLQLAKGYEDSRVFD